jgi:type II secretory pathway pseudopilin PulG
MFILATSDLRVGLISAVVGGSLGLLGGLLSASVAAYLSRQRDKKRELRELRAAARLVDDELRNAVDAATAIDLGAPFAALPTSAWVAERVRLAGALDLDDWRAIAQAYDRVQGYNWRFEARVLEKDEAERKKVCRKIIGDGGVARQRLAGYLAS